MAMFSTGSFFYFCSLCNYSVSDIACLAPNDAPFGASFTPSQAVRVEGRISANVIAIAAIEVAFSIRSSPTETER